MLERRGETEYLAGNKILFCPDFFSSKNLCSASLHEYLVRELGCSANKLIGLLGCPARSLGTVELLARAGQGWLD